jgi:protein-tyrosine phosphatase
LRTGAEIAMTHLVEIDPGELDRMTLGGGGSVLLEPPFLAVVTGIDGIVARLHGEGRRVVLAHPERCPAFHRDPDLLRSLVADGVLTSITAGSLTGRFGKQVKRLAAGLFAEEMVHNVASDAHDSHRRPPSIAAELEHAGLGEMADWLTQAVPAAILSGEQIPPRPPTAAPARRGPRRLIRRR